MFRPPHGCTSVRGKIDPGDLCDYFQRSPDMPSVSQAQSRLMAAAAHTPGGYGGVSQSVGREFNKADTGKKRSSLPTRVGKLRRRGLISDKQADRMGAR
jgi:hypothetical protein